MTATAVTPYWLRSSSHAGPSGGPLSRCSGSFDGSPNAPYVPFGRSQPSGGGSYIPYSAKLSTPPWLASAEVTLNVAVPKITDALLAAAPPKKAGTAIIVFTGVTGVKLGAIRPTALADAASLRKQMLRELGPTLKRIFPEGWLFSVDGAPVTKSQERTWAATDLLAAASTSSEAASSRHARIALIADTFSERNGGGVLRGSIRMSMRAVASLAGFVRRKISRRVSGVDKALHRAARSPVKSLLDMPTFTPSAQRAFTPSKMLQQADGGAARSPKYL